MSILIAAVTFAVSVTTFGAPSDRTSLSNDTVLLLEEVASVALPPGSPNALAVADAAVTEAAIHLRFMDDAMLLVPFARVAAEEVSLGEPITLASAGQAAHEVTSNRNYPGERVPTWNGRFLGRIESDRTPPCNYRLLMNPIPARSAWPVDHQLEIADDTYLLQAFNPSTGETVWDLVIPCRLARRSYVPGLLFAVAVMDDLVICVRSLDVNELVVYRVHLTPEKRKPL